jgi:hypothetical protein
MTSPFDWKTSGFNIVIPPDHHSKGRRVAGAKLLFKPMTSGSVAVEKLSLDGKVLNRYPSVSSAARDVNRSVAALVFHLAGKSKQCGGFKWRYCANFSTAGRGESAGKAI